MIENLKVNCPYCGRINFLEVKSIKDRNIYLSILYEGFCVCGQVLKHNEIKEVENEKGRM